MSHTPAARFVILAVPRSGSNMLCAMLGSHPSILCHHEVFNPKGIRVALELRNTIFSLGTVARRDRDPRAFLRSVWTNSHGYPCVGFKMTYRQNEVAFRELFDDAMVAKIVLRRRNRLKTYVSGEISQKLGEWEVYDREQLARRRPRVHVDPARFLERVAFDEAFYHDVRIRLRNSRDRWMEVVYEDLVAVDTHRALMRFLSVAEMARLQCRSVKQNSTDLRELVENYDDLVPVFAGTPFEAELTDRGN